MMGQILLMLTGRKREDARKTSKSRKRSETAQRCVRDKPFPYASFWAEAGAQRCWALCLGEESCDALDKPTVSRKRAFKILRR